MPGSVIASAIVSYFSITSAVAIAAITLAVNVVTSYVVSSLFLRKNDGGNRGGGAGEQQQVGNRVQLPPATNNKLPAIYGHTWIKAIITDAKISTDQKTMWYVCSLTEVPDSGGVITYGRVMWGDKTLNFQGDNITVASWTDGAGQTDTAVNGKMAVYLYTDGSSSPWRAGQQDAVSVLSTDRIAPSEKWNAPGQNNIMYKTAFAIVRVDYDQEIGLTGLNTLTVETFNSTNTPGQAFLDYFTNTRYGCAIPIGNVDDTSLAALDAYANETITVTNADGSTFTQPRYRMNGVIDTNRDCFNNLQTMADCCDSWIQWNEATSKWRVVVNQPYPTGQLSSLFPLNDDNIIGSIEFNPIDLNSSFNQIEASYPDTNIYDQAGYVYEYVRDQDKNPNEPVNSLNIELPFVNNYPQAYYIARRRLFQSREDLVVNLTTDYTGIQVDAGDLVRVTNEHYQWVNKVFRVTQVVESKDGDILNARISLAEYNDLIYTDFQVDNYVPSASTGITNPNIAVAPTNVQIVNQLVTAQVPSFTLRTTIPMAGVYQAVEFWYSSTGNVDSQYVPLKVVQAPPTGATGIPSFTGGQQIDYVVTALPAGSYFFKARTLTTTGSFSAFTAATSLPNWNPSTLVDVSTFVFDWQPSDIFIPTDSTGNVYSNNNLYGNLQLRDGAEVIELWNGVGPTQPDSTWYTPDLDPQATTGLTLTPFVFDTGNNRLSFRVLTSNTDSATATVANVVYKLPSDPFPVPVGTAAISVTKVKSGSNGTSGRNAFSSSLNLPNINFLQNFQGVWGTNTISTITYTDGNETYSATQIANVSNVGNIIFGSNTTTGNITVVTSGNNTGSGNIVYTLGGLYPVTVPVTATSNRVTISIDPPTLIFQSTNSNGSFTPTIQFIRATITPLLGGPPQQAILTAELYANGDVLIGRFSVPDGVTTSFNLHPNKINTVTFTHTASGVQQSMQVFSTTPLYANTNAATGGININYGNIEVGRVSGSPTFTSNYAPSGTSPIFIQAADDGQWTPAPSNNVISTTNTLTVQRNGVTLARRSANIDYSISSNTFSITASTSNPGDFNPTAIAFAGGNVISETQCYLPVIYTDSYGNATSAFEVNVVRGGSQGRPGPVNVVRYARFASRAAAFNNQPKTTDGITQISGPAANGIWYRTPDVFSANNPFTHTTTQFISNVVAGAPVQYTLQMTGVGGGNYLAGRSEILTITAANNKTTGEYSGLSSTFQVSGDSGGNAFPGVLNGYSSPIVYGGASGYQRFFAPGGGVPVGGRVLASQNGIDWQYQNVTISLPSGRILDSQLSATNTVFYNGRWRGVGVTSGGGVVYLSALEADITGLNWTVTSDIINPYSPTLQQRDWRYVKVVVANGNLFALGGSGYVAYSSNGTNWINMSIAGANFVLDDVKYINNRYVLIGKPSAWVTNDPIGPSSVWSQTTSGLPSTPTPNSLAPAQRRYTIAASPNRIIVLGATESFYSTTTDGSTWTQVNYPELNDGVARPRGFIHYANNMFVSSGGGGSQPVAGGGYGTVLCFSFDGVSWSAGTGGVFGDGYYRGGLTYINNTWFGDKVTSTDGRNWVRINTYDGALWESGSPIAYGNGVYAMSVIYTDPSTNQSYSTVQYSTNATNWTLLSPIPLSIFATIDYYNSSANAANSIASTFSGTFTLNPGVTATDALTNDLTDRLVAAAPSDPAGGSPLIQYVRGSSGQPTTIIYKYTAATIRPATFTRQNSGGNPPSNITITTGGVMGGGQPTTLSIANLLIPENRSRIVFNSTPSIVSGVYTWNVGTISATGFFNLGERITITAQQNANSNVFEFFGTMSQQATGTFINYDVANGRLSLTPSGFNTQSSSLPASISNLTTNSTAFIQGDTQTTSTATISFLSNSNSNSQALQLAQFFNTSEISYRANVSGNVVSLTSVAQSNLPDLTITNFVAGTNASITLNDIVINKTQDGITPNSVPGSGSTRTSITFTKANNFGAGNANVVLDYGASINQTFGNSAPPANVSIPAALANLGYYVIPVGTTSYRVVDIDPTANGTLTISINQGVNPTGTFNITQQTLSNGVVEVVPGDANRWTQPVNTGVQVV